MDIIPIKIDNGEEKAWDLVCGLPRFYPLPRAPVTLLLWLGDKEFAPRVDLFFDSTCEFQLALSDVVWAVAMMTCVVMIDADGS